jgi:hypothetical protein
MSHKEFETTFPRFSAPMTRRQWLFRTAICGVVVASTATVLTGAGPGNHAALGNAPTRHVTLPTVVIVGKREPQDSPTNAQAPGKQEAAQVHLVTHKP